MASITLEIIYEELLELKKIEELELLIPLSEEKLEESELLELKGISQNMKEGERNLWKRD